LTFQEKPFILQICTFFALLPPCPGQAAILAARESRLLFSTAMMPQQ
jgi:hypothetical protein